MLASRNTPTTFSSIRILTLKIDASKIETKAKLSRDRGDILSECFLQFTPRVQLRLESSSTSGVETETAWLFLDIASTAHLFKGEAHLARQVLARASELGLKVEGSAISNSAAGAQALACAAHTLHSTYIVPSHAEEQTLATLDLAHMAHLEGLQPWAKPHEVDRIIAFLQSIGFAKIGDLAKLSSDAFRERWGETGSLLYRRLHGRDQQVVSPLIALAPLSDFIHLDFPISLISLLLHQSEKSLRTLFMRLQGRRLFAQKITFTLHCEYSQTQHRLSIETAQPNRDLNLFIVLFERKLEELDLDNPIRDIEIEISACPEKVQQLDFFEPRVRSEDKVLNLFSLLSAASVRSGFFAIQKSVEPEGAWRLMPKPEAKLDSPQPSGIMRAPRPTRLLRKPQALSQTELRRLKILSPQPIERIENGWWQSPTRSPTIARDYYFALSDEGQCLWIYQEPKSQGYYVHGYFD